MRKLIALLFVAMFVASCKKEVSDNVDQDKIFTIYDLSYNENTDLTTAMAEFRFNNINGTRLELSEPSVVTVESEEMQWSEEHGNYTKEFPGFVPFATFGWLDLNGNSFSNTANIVDIDYPVTLPNYTYSDSVNYFMWAGAPLEESESVMVQFVGDTTARIFPVVDTVGATTVIIDSLRLSQVDGGPVTIVLEKTFNPALVEGTSKGGIITGKYRPTDRTFNLQ